MTIYKDNLGILLGGGSFSLDPTEYVEWTGVKRKSGRYAWGSGENPYQHEGWGTNLLKLDMLNGDESESNIKKIFGEEATKKWYNEEKKKWRYYEKCYQSDQARKLAEKGTEQNGWQPMGATEIAKTISERTGQHINESSIRSMLDEKRVANLQHARKVANSIKEIVDEKGMVDVGTDVERELGITRTKMDFALSLLEDEGYHIYKSRMAQVTNPQQRITQQILTTPEHEYKDVYDLKNVTSLLDYKSNDNGITISEKEPLKSPVSLDSKRLKINYKEDGGIDKDGMIEIRRGVKDLALTDSTGKSSEACYAQARIMVDGTHYLKGMVVYSDDLPKGVDVVFNTNKKKGTPMTEVLKPIKDDPENPFGSLIKEQNYYIDKDGIKRQGVINYRAIEGDWEEWKDALPSQFLAKQSYRMAQKQLSQSKQKSYDELASIEKITNPTIKKYYLNKFAENCDKSAVELKAAALPGQKYQVLLSLPTIKNTEVFAPNYENGTKLALVRFPHAGTFEIPILTVNNKNKAGINSITMQAKDAVMVHPSVAAQLSGADYDGDTVMCIPTHDSAGKVKVSSRSYLKDLVDFEPKTDYGASSKKTDNNGVTHYYDAAGNEYPIMGEKYKQKQMGVVSNLIMDMTMAGATDTEMAKAVKHSMVVIDAEKHKLNYKKSEVDNDIAALKAKYQTGGASTLITRAKSEEHVLKTQGTPKINIKGKDWYDSSKPEGSLIYKTSEDLYYPDYDKDKKTGIVTIKTTTGKKIQYDPSNEVEREKYAPVRTATTTSGKKVYDSRITNKDGTIEYRALTRTQSSTKMYEAQDARELISDRHHPMEELYADYANSMKGLANQARKEYATTKGQTYNPAAAKTYSTEVSSLKSKLNTALKNAPIEREAQRRANAEVTLKKAEAIQSGKEMTNEDVKKASQKAITKYRAELGSVKRRDRNIPITDNEWEAIQAGAIANDTLEKILNNTNPDELRERATPHESRTVSNGMIARIRSLSASGVSNAEIANRLGVSTSTVSKYLKGD